jgi:hypothetical protein
VESKICSKCGSDKPLCEFNKDKTHKDGYRSVCKLCVYSYQKERNSLKQKDKPKKETLPKKEYHKQYYQNNKEKIKEKSKLWYRNNLDKVKIAKNNYKSKKRQLDKIYREKTKESRNLKEKIKRDNNPIYKLTTNTRRLILKSFKSGNYTKNSKTFEILGCSYEDFKSYIESLWEPWMNWDNYGLYNGELNYGWDIDHIVPLSTIITKDDVIKLNHYTNLQPLCSYTNRYIKKDNH